jgi:exonuclease SbcD
MKILHTSDWHLGHRLYENSQVDEQKKFLDWLEQEVKAQSVDVLLISGDVFDTNSPSAESLKMYFNFLVKLIGTVCTHVVITGGNHDSPATLNAPKEILNALNIKVVGKSTGDVSDEVFLLEKGTESVIVGATAYLRDQDIRRAVDGEKFEEITDRYKSALVNHYDDVAKCCLEIQQEHRNAPIIGMGHLFAVDGSTSDSEQSIYVGTLGHIGAKDFPKAFDYIALGHLHRPQLVGGNEKIRYCGSPNILSFSEIGYDKKVIILETNGNIITSITDSIIPKFRELCRIKGSKEVCLAKVKEIEPSTNELTTWVEVEVDEAGNDYKGFQEIYDAVEDTGIEIVKVTHKNKRSITGLEELVKNAESVKDLTPEEIFEKKYTEAGNKKEDLTEVIDAFTEILNIVREKD